MKQKDEVSVRKEDGDGRMDAVPARERGLWALGWGAQVTLTPVLSNRSP